MVKAYSKHFLSVFLGFMVAFLLLKNSEDLNMICKWSASIHVWESDQTINQHYHNEVCFLSLILLIFLDISAKEI